MIIRRSGVRVSLGALVVVPCLVPIRRLSKPSRSMYFGDVSEMKGRETFSDHVTRNASAAHNNEA